MTADSTTSVSTPLSSPKKMQGKRKEPDYASTGDSVDANRVSDVGAAPKAVDDAPALSPTSPVSPVTRNEVGIRKPDPPNSGTKYKMKSPPKRKPVSIYPEELTNTSTLVSEQECIPSLVPLPESEPPTPMKAATFQSPPQSPTPGATKEHKTPESPSKQPPSAATLARPPPLPPRAAARAARVPTPDAAVAGIGTNIITDSDHKPEPKQTPEVEEATTDVASDKVDEPTVQVDQVAETASAMDNPSPSSTVKPNPSQNTMPEAEASLVNDVNVDAKTNGVGVPAEHGDEGETTNKAKDTEVYIGDATWEERTWKELVRLKEDMFLARIGGSR
jgi:Rab guanine nucleotide exchange factor SEC2